MKNSQQASAKAFSRKWEGKGYEKVNSQSNQNVSFSCCSSSVFPWSMKRHSIIPIILVIICSAAVFSCESRQGPFMKVVLNGDEILGRFIEETPDSYIVEVQDTYPLEKTGLTVEVWKASDGKGIVYLKDYGSADAYSEPDKASSIVGVLTYEEGYVPDTYDCLGYSEGWFAVELESGKAYVQEDLVIWDAIDTF